jgi:NitT/TauT family transport system ATP-binding protein
MTSSAFVDFSHVWLAYNEELLAQGQFAVEDIDLKIGAGEFTAIVGPSPPACACRQGARS